MAAQFVVTFADAAEHALSERTRTAADFVNASAIERGASLYIRERDLPKLFPPYKLAGKSDGEIVDMLRRCVVASQKALASGHWAADGNRVMALRMALKAEEGMERAVRRVVEGEW